MSRTHGLPLKFPYVLPATTATGGHTVHTFITCFAPLAYDNESTSYHPGRKIGQCHVGPALKRCSRFRSDARRPIWTELRTRTWRRSWRWVPAPCRVYSRMEMTRGTVGTMFEDCERATEDVDGLKATPAKSNSAKLIAHTGRVRTRIALLSLITSWICRVSMMQYDEALSA
jgi:hypothetical protein